MKFKYHGDEIRHQQIDSYDEWPYIDTIDSVPEESESDLVNPAFRKFRFETNDGALRKRRIGVNDKLRFSDDISVNEKYILFSKWLNDQEQTEKRKAELDDDNSSKDVDEFLDAEDQTPNITDEGELTLPAIKNCPIEQEYTLNAINLKIDETSVPVQVVANKLENVNALAVETKKCLSETDKEEIKLVTTIDDEERYNQLSVATKSSPRGSTNDLTKKHVSHNKGKAPVPPPSPVPSVLSISIVDSEALIDGSVVDSKTICDKTDDKKSKKTLMNYIPSIFKPISPSNSSKNILKETDI